MRPAFHGGPVWKPPGDLFALMVLGALALALIVTIRVLAPR